MEEFTDSKLYSEFIYYIDSPQVRTYGFTDKLIPEKLKPIIELIKSFKGDINRWVKIFKDSKVFKFFEELSFSIKKVYDLVKKGFSYIHLILDEISIYLSRTKVVDWTNKELTKLDEWLSKNPKLKRLGGAIVAGILLYIWLNMSFLGDVEFDFDMSLIVSSLAGAYSLSDIFSTPQGIKMLGLLVTGVIGLTFPWSSIPQFGIAIGNLLYQSYLKIKKHTMKQVIFKSKNNNLIKLFSTIRVKTQSNYSTGNMFNLLIKFSEPLDKSEYLTELMNVVKLINNYEVKFIRVDRLNLYTYSFDFELLKGFNQSDFKIIRENLLSGTSTMYEVSKVIIDKELIKPIITQDMMDHSFNSDEDNERLQEENRH